MQHNGCMVENETQQAEMEGWSTLRSQAGTARAWCGKRGRQQAAAGGMAHLASSRRRTAPSMSASLTSPRATLLLQAATGETRGWCVERVMQA